MRARRKNIKTMENINIELMSEEVQVIIQTLSNIERMMKELTQKNNTPIEELMGINDASAYINLSHSTIYSLTRANKIPYMKQGRKLYFSQKDLLAWMKESNRKPL